MSKFHHHDDNKTLRLLIKRLQLSCRVRARGNGRLHVAKSRTRLFGIICLNRVGEKIVVPSKKLETVLCFTINDY